MILRHTAGRSSAERSFEDFGYLPDGSEDPDFVLSQEPYRSASILLAGENFGSRSTPESAVSRLMELGLRAVIAPSFGAAFHDRCIASGILTVSLDAEVIEELAHRIRANPEVKTTVDLEEQEIQRPGMEAIEFRVEPRVRKKLLLGLTDLDEMRRHTENVAAFRDWDRNRRPWIYDWRDASRN